MMKNKGVYTPDISLIDRKNMLQEEMIGETLIVFLFGVWLIGSISAYGVRYGEVDLSEVFWVLKENPIFMLAVICWRPGYAGQILGSAFCGALFLELFVLMDYYRRRSLLHNDVWTAKGSSRFQQKKEIWQTVLRYAEVK